MTTTDDLAALLAAATPGPWHSEADDGPESKWMKASLGVWSRHLYDASDAEGHGDDPMDDAWICGIWGEIDGEHLANARLIALAPTLAAEVLTLRAKLAEAEGALVEAIESIDAAYDGPDDEGRYSQRQRAALAKIREVM